MTYVQTFMPFNLLITNTFKKYPLTIILQFIDAQPAPEASLYQFFTIKSSEGLKAQVWGQNPQDVLEQFDDFVKLLIFA